MALFVQKWGVEAEKSLRSMKALQEKRLEKIARLLNSMLGEECFGEKKHLFYKKLVRSNVFMLSHAL